MDDFIQGLAYQGFRVGENIEFRRWYAHRSADLLQTCIDEIISWGPTLIGSFHTRANVALKNDLRIDVYPVLCWATNLVAAGLVKSNRKPGMNFTGFSFGPDENYLKVRFLRKIKPNFKKLAHIYSLGYPPAPITRAEIKGIAISDGLEYHEFACDSPDCFDSVIEQIVVAGCEGVVVGPNPILNIYSETLGEKLARAQLPTVGNQGGLPRGGALAAMVSPKRLGWRLMANVAIQIFEGDHPSTIPVLRSLRSTLILNKSAAQSFGINPGDALLDEADVLL